MLFVHNYLPNLFAAEAEASKKDDQKQRSRGIRTHPSPRRALEHIV
jgi:hypothetical protein